MSSAGSSALSGAASGAATGAAFGPWGAAIGGAVGLVGGFLGGKKMDAAAKEAKRERKLYGEQQMAMNKELYDQERKIMRPIKERLGAEAMSSEPLDYAQISGRIRENYANALRRINETSGIGAARSQSARLKMATELAGAYGQGLANRRNLGLTLMSKDQTATYANQLGRSYENMAEVARQEQAAYEQSAAQNWQAAASGLGQLAYGVSGIMGGGTNQPMTKAGATFTVGQVANSTPTYGGGLNTATVSGGLTGGGYAGLPKLG
jgi:hypothetical protein